MKVHKCSIYQDYYYYYHFTKHTPTRLQLWENASTRVWEPMKRFPGQPGTKLKHFQQTIKHIVQANKLSLGVFPLRQSTGTVPSIESAFQTLNHISLHLFPNMQQIFNKKNLYYEITPIKQLGTTNGLWFLGKNAFHKWQGKATPTCVARQLSQSPLHAGQKSNSTKQKYHKQKYTTSLSLFHTHNCTGRSQLLGNVTKITTDLQILIQVRSTHKMEKAKISKRDLPQSHLVMLQRGMQTSIVAEQ